VRFTKIDVTNNLKPIDSYSTIPTQTVRAANGIDFAYRRIGSGAHLVLLQHFRGNLDYWDPAHSSAAY
jgi:hypothetical protein